jgi:hypothetical protein
MDHNATFRHGNQIESNQNCKCIPLSSCPFFSSLHEMYLRVQHEKKLLTQRQYHLLKTPKSTYDSTKATRQ